MYVQCMYTRSKSCDVYWIIEIKGFTNSGKTAVNWLLMKRRAKKLSQQGFPRPLFSVNPGARLQLS